MLGCRLRVSMVGLSMVGIGVICVFLYSAVHSVGPLKALNPSPPGRPIHSDTNSASPGSILAMQQLRSTTKSLTCPPLSIARYSFLQLSELGRQCRER